MRSLTDMEREAYDLAPVARHADVAELTRREAPGWKPRQAELLRSGEPVAAGGQWYQDSRAPFSADDFPAITLATTSLMLWPASVWTPTTAADWFTGKRFQLHVFGKITTALTPGNLTVEIRYGTTDNGGILLATSAALTLIASQTNISWNLEAYINCRDTGQPGTNGSLFATGRFQVGTAVIAVGTALIPASAAVAVAADTTITSGINVQFKRSGSTAETATVHTLTLSALN